MPLRLLPTTLFLLLTTALPAQIAHDGFPVRTTVAQGELEGILSTVSGVRHYYGVPFAAPPTGERRWRAPAPPAAWAGVRQAKTFAPRAVQRYVYDDMRFRSPMNEDCLYLNVWQPAPDDRYPHPILLYFHGGGNQAGSGDEPRYDGEHLARQGIIVVTANYRLGVFGFLAHPELTAEAGGSGNYGLMDQAAALEWVRANAAAFGGDPDRITIGGESAGAMDCSLLMASPRSRDAIAGVFGQSGSALVGDYAPVPLAEAEQIGVSLLANSPYPSIADLRRATTAEVYDLRWTQPNQRFPLTVDGVFLPRHPREIFRDGQQARVPLLVGWTDVEAAWAQPQRDPAAYESLIRNQFPDPERAARILDLYPSADHVRSYLDLASDRFIVAATWLWADLHARTGGAPVYRYRFDRVRPPLVGQDRPSPPPGAAHATDIEYFFGSLPKSDAYAWEKADYEVANSMVRQLVGFVYTGKPNVDYPSPKPVSWPPVVPDRPHPVFVFNVETRLEEAPAREVARFQEINGKE